MIKLLVGDALEQLRTLPDESVHCCVTSPPYWGLRDYKVEGQLGLEKTPEEYITKMVEIFREVKRVLRKDGVLFLNMGDSYASEFQRGTAWGDHSKKLLKITGAHGELGPKRDWSIWDLKPKDLVGMPWRLAFALQADGWWLRSDIIWSKPNPMPESVTDRPTKAHEYIFLLTKNSKYFYDQEAVREESTGSYKSSDFIPASQKDLLAGFKTGPSGASFNNRTDDERRGRNSRTVWEIATQPYAEAHFATFPEELPRRCIKAGTSEKGCCPKCGNPWERIVEKGDIISRGGSTKGKRATIGDNQGLLRNDNKDEKVARESFTVGWQPTCSCSISEVVPCIVLDPFAGSGTTGQVARSLGRKSILIELNPEYAKLIENRALSNVPDICEMTT